MARKSRKNVITEPSMKSSVFIRTAVYLRLSVEDNNNRGNSLENQQLIIQDYLADKPEFKIVGTYTDNGLSGLNYNRPGFQRMLEEIEAGRIDCVIVKDLSRLGRNFIDTGYYIEQYFVTRNIRFIAVTDQFDSSCADQLHGGIMLPLKNMINEAYALDIGRKIKAQAHQAMLDGEFVGARAPYGYMKDPKNCHKLIVDEGAAPVVRQIFQWAYEKMGLNQIVLRLNEAGVVTPNIYKQEHGYEGKRYKTGSEKWQTRTVAMILRNRTYTGDLVQGKSKTVDHRQMPANPEDYIIVRDTHPALVSREVFDAVQAYRRQVAGICTDKTPIPYTPNAFQGKIFCGHCGKALHRQRSHRSKGDDIYLFHCLSNTRVAKGACEGVYITEKELNESLTVIVEKELDTVVGHSIPMMQQEKQYTQHRAAILSQISENRKALEKDRGLIQGLYEDMVEGLISREEYLSLKADMEEHTQALSQSIAALEKEKANADKAWQRQKAMESQAAQLTENHALTAELIASLFTRIEVFHDHHFHIAFSFQDELIREAAHG